MLDQQVYAIIILLLNHLPDSMHYQDDPTWDDAWENLGWEAQNNVSGAREAAIDSLVACGQRETGAINEG